MKNILWHVICLSAAGSLSAATLQVGPGQSYAKPCDAILAAAPGDTILIDATGTYNGDVCTWYTNGLTIRGVNGKPHIDAAGRNSGGKGTWVIEGNDTVIENVELSGSTVPDGNGAGIRMQGLNLTLRNVYIHHNQDGLLTGDGGEILIEYSEFAFNGTTNGFTHNIYIGYVQKFTLDHSYSHDSSVGQLVKSRGRENHILYNRLTCESGTTSYEVDLPSGGLSYVIGNLIQQGPNDQNNTILEYMVETNNPMNPNTDLYVINNTFVNSRTTGQFVYVAPGDHVPAVIQNNIFYGPGTITNQASAILSTNLVGGNPMFVNLAGYDYHLQAGSPAIDAGTDPGMGDGQPLMPDSQYLPPVCGEARTTVGTAIDIGAYEFGGGGAIDACSPTGAPMLSIMSASPSTVVAGANATGYPQLDSPATAGGAMVTLVSSNPTVAAVPSNVMIPAGSASAPVLITTGGVANTTTVTLSATYNGVTKKGTITVNPPGAVLTGITVNPTAVLSGATATVTVTIDGPSPAGGTVINLSSSPTSVATLPASVTIPQNATSATVTVTAKTVAKTLGSTLTASHTGVQQQVIVWVNPPAAAGYSVSAPLSALAGSNITVTFKAPAGRPANDYVALYLLGTRPWTALTGGKTSGSFTFTLPKVKGMYTFRYYQAVTGALEAQTALINVH